MALEGKGGMTARFLASMNSSIQIGNEYRRRSEHWGKVVNFVLESFRCLEKSGSWIGWSLENGPWSAD